MSGSHGRRHDAHRGGGRGGWHHHQAAGSAGGATRQDSAACGGGDQDALHEVSDFIPSIRKCPQTPAVHMVRTAVYPLAYAEQVRRNCGGPFGLTAICNVSLTGLRTYSFSSRCCWNLRPQSKSVATSTGSIMTFYACLSTVVSHRMPTTCSLGKSWCCLVDCTCWWLLGTFSSTDYFE